MSVPIRAVRPQRSSMHPSRNLLVAATRPVVEQVESRILLFGPTSPVGQVELNLASYFTTSAVTATVLDVNFTGTLQLNIESYDAAGNFLDAEQHTGVATIEANRYAKTVQGTTNASGENDNLLTLAVGGRVEVNYFDTDTNGSGADGFAVDTAPVTSPNFPLSTFDFSSMAVIDPPFVEEIPDDEGFSYSGPWQLTSNRASDAGHSGTNSFYFGNLSTGTYDSNSTGTLTSAPIDLPGGEPIQLAFNQYLDTEFFDVAKVQVSANGGAFQDVTGNLPSTLTWAEQTLDLSAFAGQRIQIRFSFAADASDSFEGWYVDDVSLRVARGSVAGTVYSDDTNRSGTLNAGDAPVSGATVFLDRNDNGVRDLSAAATWFNGTPQAIPDNNPTGIESQLNVSGVTGPITDLNVVFNINHPYVADVKLILVSPGGAVQATILDNVGGSSDNFTGTRLDDEAAAFIGTNIGPFAGNYRPTNALSPFDGIDPNGLWTLKVIDEAVSDVGTLENWTLEFNSDSVDEPQTTTASDGTYAFTGLQPGPAKVVQTLANGVAQLVSPPVDDLQLGQQVTGRDLLNLTFAKLSTTVPGQLDITGTEVGDSFQFANSDPLSVFFYAPLAQTPLGSLLGIAAFTGVTNVNIQLLGGDDFVASGVPVPAAIDGGAGNDLLQGGAQDDTLIGGLGNDQLTGFGGADKFQFGNVTTAEKDAIFDSIPSDQADDILDFSTLTTSGISLNLSQPVVNPENPAPGEDLLLIPHANRSIQMYNTSVDDIRHVRGTNQADTITGNGLANSLFGGGGNDSLRGENGADSLVGDGGNDTFVGGAGSDTLVGGGNDDLYRFGGAVSPTEADRVSEAAGGGTDTLDFSALPSPGGVVVNLLSDTLATHTNRVLSTLVAGQAPQFENVIGSISADNITGNNANNTIVGGSGADSLRGENGSDSLVGDAGNDTFVGGAGSDTLVGGGNDDLYRFGGAVSPTEADRVSEAAGGGTDTLDFSALPAASGVVVNLLSDTLATHTNRVLSTLVAGQAPQFENVIGSISADNITGNNANNTIVGGSGADSLRGENGADSLQGDGGNDTFVGGAGSDTLVGGGNDDLYRFGGAVSPTEADRVSEAAGGGTDTLDFSALPAATGVVVNLLSDTLATHTNRVLSTLVAGQAPQFENVIGSISADNITGNNANNTIVGGLGNDTLTGGLGLDRLDGGDNNDTFFARSSPADADTILGGAGSDSLQRDTLDSATLVEVILP